MAKQENVFNLPVDPGPSSRDVELAGGNTLPFEYFKFLLEEGIGIPLEYIDDELLQIVDGNEAQAMATVVYTRWRAERKQLSAKIKRRSRFPNKALSRYLPTITPEVSRAMHVRFLFKDVISIKNNYYNSKKPDEAPQFIEVPVKVERDMYVFEEVTGSISCFSDQQGFPILTPLTYQALKRQGITSANNIAAILSEIYRKANVINPQRFEGHINKQEELAKAHDIDFSVAKKVLKRDYIIGSLDGHPIMCTATGVRSAKHVKQMFRETVERRTSNGQIQYEDFSRTISEGNGESLLRIERSKEYLADMFAHAGVMAYETPDKKSSQRAKIFLNKAVRYLDVLGEYTHLIPSSVIVPKYFSCMSEMALTLDTHQRSVLAKIFIENPNDRVKVEEAWNCETYISREFIPSKHKGQRDEFLLGRNIGEFLFWGDTTQLIRKNSPHEPRITGYDRRISIAAELNRGPATNTEGITIHDLDTVKHTGPEYTFAVKNGYQTLTECVYILELFCDPQTKGEFLASADFPVLISELLGDLHNPDIQKQCGKGEWQYLVTFLLWLHTSLTDLSSQAYTSDEKRTIAIQSWMKTVIHAIQQKDTLQQAARHCFKSIISYHQNTGALQNIRMLGYTLVDAKREYAHEPFITIYGDERPLHLALKQAGDLTIEIMWNLNRLLSINNMDDITDGTSVSEQLIQISRDDTPQVCSRYVYIPGEKESKRQEWIMPTQHRDRVCAYVQEHGLTSWDPKQNIISYEKHHLQSKEAGVRFIKEELMYLNTLLQEIFHQTSSGNACTKELQDFVDECEFFANTYCFDGRSSHPFPIRELDRLVDYVKELQRTLDNTGWTIGNKDMQPITVTQTKPLVIFGENMSGKSTLMRIISQNALLQHRSIATLGTQHTNVETICSLNGREQQVTTGSLFIEQLRGINLSLHDDADLMFADEPFRQTSSRYALLFTTGTIIAEALNPKRKRLQVMACNQPEMRTFDPLFEQLGIRPQYVITDKERGLRLATNEDSLEDIAIPALKKHMPNALAQNYWGIETENGEETQRVSKKQIHTSTVQDIFGQTESEQIASVAHCFSTSRSVAKQILHTFIENPDGKNVGAVFETLSHTPHLARSIDALSTFERILSAHKIKDPIARYQSIHDLDISLSDQLTDEQLPKEQRATEYYINETFQVIEFITGIPGLSKYINFSVLPKTIEDLYTTLGQHVATENSTYKSAFEEEFEKCLAVLHLSQTFVNHGFKRSTFTRDRVITATDCWNPLFSKNQMDQTPIVSNSYRINFDDDIAGTVKCGEHHSGKTNNLRGDEAASLLLAQCFGWSTGEISLPESLVLLSKTQPVYDTQTRSGMDRELELRIMPALSVLRYASEHPNACVLTCLDEPGVRTSPVDARKLLLMLYQEYAKHPHVKLHTTTHIDQLSDQLNQLGVETHREGFVYIDPDKRYRVQENQTDSQALEIASLFHFDPWVLRITEILKQYYDELQQFPLGLPEQRVLAYAKAINGQQKTFFA